MNYYEELGKLKKDQDRLDWIRKETRMVFNKIWYSLVFLVGLGLVFWLSILWIFGITEGNRGAISIAVLQSVFEITVDIVIVIHWFLNLEKRVESIDEFFDSLVEGSKLRKSEKDRKDKIDFFERLLKDPEFRQAWEEQMRGSL